MNDVQTGDTVEVIDAPLYGHYYHPTENRPLRNGDRVVVAKITDDFVCYMDFYKNHRGMFFFRVRKIIPNQVEIKFR
jgi:hypothetical protein